MVSASRPEGLTAPVSTSATADPVACPASQHSSTADAAWSQVLVRTAPPLHSTATIGVPGTASASLVSRLVWASGRSMCARS